MSPVTSSNIAKVMLDSGCFDHCCEQFEFREATFLNAAAVNTTKTQALRSENHRGWATDANGVEMPLKMNFDVLDVKSTPLSTSILRKHGFPVVRGERQRMLDRTDR